MARFEAEIVGCSDPVRLSHSMRRNGMPITKWGKDETGTLVMAAAFEAEDYVTARDWVCALSGDDFKVISIRGANEIARFETDDFWTSVSTTKSGS